MAPKPTATTILNTLTSPIRHLSLTAHHHHSSSAPAPSPHKDSTPTSWICHHCIYLVPLTSASTAFSKRICKGCDHERCGLCDVVYVSGKEGGPKMIDVDMGVRDGEEYGGTERARMWYHWDNSGGEVWLQASA